MDRDQAEPLRIRDPARHGLGFAQIDEHLLELAERDRARRAARGARRSPAPASARSRAGGAAPPSASSRQASASRCADFACALTAALPEIRRRLVPELPAPEVIRDQLDDLLDAPGVQLFEARDRRPRGTCAACARACPPYTTSWVSACLKLYVGSGSCALGKMKSRRVQLAQAPRHVPGASSRIRATAAKCRSAARLPPPPAASASAAPRGGRCAPR